MNLKIGEKYNHSFEVTDETVRRFIALSKDENPLHTDINFALLRGFSSKVVHGNIQNCFISFFVGHIFPIKEILILSQSIKYLKPVYVEDKLELKSEIVNFSESVGVYELVFSFNRKKELVSRGVLMLKKI